MIAKDNNVTISVVKQTEAQIRFLYLVEFWHRLLYWKWCYLERNG